MGSGDSSMIPFVDWKNKTFGINAWLTWKFTTHWHKLKKPIFTKQTFLKNLIKDYFDFSKYTFGVIAGVEWSGKVDICKRDIVHARSLDSKPEKMCINLDTEIVKL